MAPIRQRLSPSACGKCDMMNPSNFIPRHHQVLQLRQLIPAPGLIATRHIAHDSTPSTVPYNFHYHTCHARSNSGSWDMHSTESSSGSSPPHSSLLYTHSITPYHSRGRTGSAVSGTRGNSGGFDEEEKSLSVDDDRESSKDHAGGASSSGQDIAQHNQTDAEQQETSSRSSEGTSGSEHEADSPGVSVALGLLRFYKAGISPLMPSVCRYQPSCSSYSMQSYQEYGAWKGTVLMVWRVLRCNPWGSSGYDPPSWPPVGLGLVFDNVEWAPQVFVVLFSIGGTAVLHSLWTSLFP